MKNYRIILLTLTAMLMGTTANADSVKLAEWNMETSDDIAVTWFAQGGAPQITPDECVGSASDYVLTGWSEGRYWQLCSGWQNKVLRIENTTANDISDYTDASLHNCYYEVQFPTTGYKDITVDFACAYGANAEATIEAVVSTDGGQTWFDAGSFTTMPNWWLYKDNTVTISANNKEKVILRLIAGNGFTSNWNLDYVKVTGGKMEATQPVNELDFTLTWPLGQGNSDATAAQVSKPGLFSVAEFDHGQMTVSTQRAVGNCQQTLYKPSNNNAGQPNDDDALTFTIKPKKGLTFAPKSFTFDASRWGTNGGKFDVVAISGGQQVTLATAKTPARGNDGLFDSYSFDLSGLTTDANGLVLKIMIYGLASNKEYGFANVVVTGDVTGTPEAVPTYTMSVKLGTEGAGTVSCTPAGEEFDEGTILTVTATENFGFHFAGWTDEMGNFVSSENPYSFEISANTTLVATYTQKNVYALNIVLEGGANANLVQFLPVGNVVDGIHHYEEGTDVKLTAVNNRILTFTNWEDGTTAQERDVQMDEQKHITATFSAIDYIVGWDMYENEPRSERAADYKSDTENAGLLSLRNAAGQTTSWLPNGAATGKVQGRYAIRCWRPIADNWYFEISFSSKGYQNLKLSAAVGDDYNAYSIVNAQYSTDGQTFTTFGTYELPNRGWTDGEFSLPAEASDQQRVWIRFMPDYTSPKVGVESANDGLMLTDVFVLADATGVADEVATLIASNPAQNGTGASASGSIILTFDNKVKAGQGNATLKASASDDSTVEQIAPVISGKTAIFRYSGLKYNTEYTFQMPEGVLLSRSGNAVAAATINFTTMERQQPELRLYDAVVDATGTVPAGFTGQVYTTVQAAIDAAPAGRAKPWLIFIMNGQYKEHVDIPANKPYLHFIGQSRDQVVIKDDRMAGGPNAQHVSVAATVVVNADNIFFENLSMENIYGYENLAGPQALALNTMGDRICMNNVALLSYQDTWITTSTQKNRHFIKNSLIEGAVDFIYNGGDVYLDGDTIQINRPSGGYIVAPWHTAQTKWGYVFQNNIIRPRPGINVNDVWLGRPWHGEPKTVFINTQTFVNIPAKGWYNTMGGLPVLWAEYNTVDKNGNPIDLSQRETYYYYIDSNTGEKHETFNVKNTLTAEEAAQYTIKNVCGGDDNWQPDLMCEACESPVVTVQGGKLTWQAVPYAICYVVTKGSEVVTITTACEAPFSGNADEYTVQAVNENGGLSLMGGTSTAVSISNLRLTTSETYFNLSGRQMPQTQRGINIVRRQDGTVRKVVM